MNGVTENSNLCLIGGSGRSGTTILRRIFSAHPLVANVSEWRGNIDPDGPLDFFVTFSNCWSPHFFDKKIRRLDIYLKNLEASSILTRGVTYLFHKIGLKPIPVFKYKLSPSYANVGIGVYSPNFKKIRRKLISNLTHFNYSGQWVGSKMFSESTLYYAPPFNKLELSLIFREFYFDVIEDILKDQGVRYYIEDNTWNYLWFNHLLEIFPTAKMVHIYRDPRDVVASYLKQRWAPNDVEKAAIFYRDLMTHWESTKSLISSSSYIEISLDNLVNDTEETLNEICGFWNIPWDDNLLSLDLSKSNKDRWKNDFTSEEQDLLELIVGELVR